MEQSQLTPVLPALDAAHIPVIHAEAASDLSQRASRKASSMDLVLCAASARQHPRVPTSNRHKVIWVIVEPPRVGMDGRRLYRVVIDVDGHLCLPAWRQVDAEAVELLSPEQYPIRTLEVIDPPHEEPRTACAVCGRAFRLPGQRGAHESVCGHEAPTTLKARRNERESGRGYWWRKGQHAAVAVLALVACAGCRPPPLVLSAPGDLLQQAQDREFIEALTDRVNALSHCVDIATRACMVQELNSAKGE